MSPCCSGSAIGLAACTVIRGGVYFLGMRRRGTEGKAREGTLDVRAGGGGGGIIGLDGPVVVVGCAGVFSRGRRSGEGPRWSIEESRLRVRYSFGEGPRNRDGSPMVAAGGGPGGGGGNRSRALVFSDAFRYACRAYESGLFILVARGGCGPDSCDP